MPSKMLSTHMRKETPGVTAAAAATMQPSTTPSHSSEIDMTPYNDDVDTSFEIDDPEEDDFIYIESVHGTALVLAANRANRNAAVATTVSLVAATSAMSLPTTPCKQLQLPPEVTAISTITDSLTALSTDADGASDTAIGELENIETDSADSSVLNSGSSTPTTTDVADLSNHNAQQQAPVHNGLHRKQQQRPLPQHCSLSPAMQYHCINNNNNNNSLNYKNSPQNNNRNNNNYNSSGAYKQIVINGIALVNDSGQETSAAVEQQINASNALADDNLSSSIATTVTTTTTEIDMDNITNTSQQSPQSAQHSQSRRSQLQQPGLSVPCTKAKDGDLNVARNACKDDAIVSVCSSSAGGHKRTQSATSQASQKSHLPSVESLQPKMQIWRWTCNRFKSTGIGKPSVHHAMVVIFLEYFAWGLLTMPVIQNLKQIFPHHTFLMNGMLLGIKGLLSFLSAPLVGALSDIWGRKIFFLVTVFFTCSPIPLLTINLSWFFAMISISGIFAVTFSVVFAYVADVTTVEERSRAYGLVSATFAASLVISPALGNVLMNLYGDAFVVAIGIAIAVLDIFFILVAVPESLPEKVRPSTWGAPINWEQADPFAALRKVGTNRTVMMQCVTVLLSNLPEAGQYSSIFVYLKWKIGFNTLEVSIFIAFVGILSISVQVTLGFFMRVFGAKSTIIIGLTFEMVQMLWFGLANEPWMMWGAGLLAALGSIAYPAISAFVSIHSNADSQGAVQGMLTGVRGLCNGLGPAVFGVIFYFFDVDLDETTTIVDGDVVVQPDRSKLVPGPPFLFGAVMVVIAICVAVFIPETPNAEEPTSSFSRTSSTDKKHVQYEIESGRKLSTTMLDARAPLMRSDSMAQL